MNELQASAIWMLPGCGRKAFIKTDRMETKLISLIISIDSDIEKPSPPDPLDILLARPPVDPQLRVDARSGKHNVVPVPAHKHQICSRVWIGLDHVQKDLGEHFYGETLGFGKRRRVGPIELRIHGKFRDLTGIDSSALGDGKSQGVLTCGGIQPARRARLANRIAFSGQTPRKRRLDRTKYVPP